MTQIDQTTGNPSDSTSADGSKSRRRGTGLNAMLLPELQSLASSMGIPGVARLRKSQLVEAINARGTSGGASSAGASGPSQTSSAPSSSAGSAGSAPSAGSAGTPNGDRPGHDARTPEATAPVAGSNGSGAETSAATDSRPDGQRRTRRGRRGANDSPTASDGAATGTAGASAEPNASGATEQAAANAAPAENSGAGSVTVTSEPATTPPAARQDGQPDRQGQDRQQQDRSNDRQQSDRQQNDRQQQGGQDRQQGGQNRQQGRQGQNDRPQQDRQGGGQNDGYDDDGTSRRGRRRRRDRSGNSGGGNGGSGAGNNNRYNRNRADRFNGEIDTTVNEDDVLLPVAGILDVPENANYAFLRTGGYLPGPNDVYVSLSMVRRYGLRKGDAITGQVRQEREDGRQQKFNPLVRLEQVNGGDPEAAKARPEFAKLTPLYPQTRLRLETEQSKVMGRIIDIVAPIGKGQRGLIVSPPKAGKTMIMQSIAASIAINNPEVHLMVVLVDERPEEVTDFQRTVKGEVISSTFDRPATDHTLVAELAIERAKRLVELGHDVVVLLDGITRLSRAYNLAAPASGRVLSGGIDAGALYPPKKFFGAARNIEHGGSLTILATALVDTNSRMDDAIFEEFKGTGNSELRLDRKLSEKRIFPAIDVDASSTRREELLMTRDELQATWKLRRVLGALDSQQALELLLDRLRKTERNIDFLMNVQKTTPGMNTDNIS